MLRSAWTVACVYLAFSAGSALAQSPFLEPPLDRRVEGYQAVGGRVGSFAILPSAIVSGVYDGNVFATSRGRQDDYVLDMRPEIVARSGWSRHLLEFRMGGQILEFDRFSSENQANFFAGANGHYEIASDMRVVAFTNYAHSHEARGTGNSFELFDKPIAYDRVEGGALLHKTFNRLWTEVGGSARADTYQNTTLNGVVVDQQYRNVTVTEAVNRTGYEVSPKTSLFVETAYGWRDYEDTTFDNQGYRVLGGVQMEASRILRGEVSGGWMSYSGEGAANVGSVDTYSYRARVFWEPTTLILVAITGGRDVGVSAEGGKSLTVTSDLGVRVDYELLRNLILTGRFGYQFTDYLGSSRRDELRKAEFLTEYLMSRTWSLVGSYAFTDFDSTTADLDYSKHVVSLGVRARY